MHTGDMVGAAGETHSEKCQEQGHFLATSGLLNLSPRFMLIVNINQANVLGMTAHG